MDRGLGMEEEEALLPAESSGAESSVASLKEMSFQTPNYDLG